jgi:hypothetical protein
LLTDGLEQGREVDSETVVCISDDSEVLAAGNRDVSSGKIRFSASTVKEDRMTFDEMKCHGTCVVAVNSHHGVRGVRAFL